MNPFDELSIEESVRIREKERYPGGVEEIIALSIGPPKSVDILRTAMAMGADRSIFVEVKDGEEVEPLAVGKIIQKLVEREKVNLVMCGKQSIDDDSGQTGQIVAGLMGWGAATQASKVKFGEGGVEVEKEVDGGTGMFESMSAARRGEVLIEWQKRLGVSYRWLSRLIYG